jgi:V/A-type H+-transporting ATPase subunit G/H
LIRYAQACAFTNYSLLTINCELIKGGDILAVEAVLKVKEAEEQSREILRAASDAARAILLNAEKEAARQKRSILDAAADERKALVEAAVSQAEWDAGPLVAEGAKDRELLLSPDTGKFEGAVNLIVERIVSGDGDHEYEHL